jgi:rubrerythrin
VSNADTVETLFELAITAEKKNKEFYVGLAKIFSPQREVANFWLGMVMEEEQHTQELENIRKSLLPSQLSFPVDSSILQKARKAVTFSVTESLNSIANLEDAYQIVYELERSEVNTVFAFIMNEFIPSDNQKKFMLLQLENHTQKIVKFSEIFGESDLRKKVLAQPSVAQTGNTDPTPLEIKTHI